MNTKKIIERLNRIEAALSPEKTGYRVFYQEAGIPNGWAQDENDVLVELETVVGDRIIVRFVGREMEMQLPPEEVLQDALENNRDALCVAFDDDGLINEKYQMAFDKLSAEERETLVSRAIESNKWWRVEGGKVAIPKVISG